MRCPECGSDDLAIGAYDADRDHVVCDQCFHSWLVEADPWDAKARAIEQALHEIAQAEDAALCLATPLSLRDLTLNDEELKAIQRNLARGVGVLKRVPRSRVDRGATPSHLAPDE